MSNFTSLMSSPLNARRNVSRSSLVRVLGGESQMPWFQNIHAHVRLRGQGEHRAQFLPKEVCSRLCSVSAGVIFS